MASAAAAVSLSVMNQHQLCSFHLPSHLSFSFIPIPNNRRMRMRGALLQARAKKKNAKSKKDRSNSDDTASEVFFPEAVLLKKKTNDATQPLPQFADAQQEKLFEALSLQLESDLNLERMRHYEVVFLIHEKYDQQVEEVVTKVEDFIREKKGRIWRLNDWGLRRLAYEIKKAMRAHYILMNFEIDAKFVNDFKTMLDKDERVIRHLVSKEEKAETAYCPPPIEYQTLLARQGFGEDDGFWDDDDDDDDEAMYDDGDYDYDDDEGEEEGYEDDGDVLSDEDGGEVIYVDGDEDHDENREMMRKMENVSR
ncbi:30S ribosomal S6 [Rhynchospora pubera]|uniref:30S ribosomal S6 n=1 Tax=Rhynchospora pubera TaxID=906938 RepID=A0AAV8GXE8_9POAL|nr:30S ribosomal S6 [Rhynchospora pubera]